MSSERATEAELEKALCTLVDALNVNDEYYTPGDERKALDVIRALFSRLRAERDIYESAAAKALNERDEARAELDRLVEYHRGKGEP